MRKPVRCISIDIDGTLIPEYSFRSKEIEEKNIGAIKVFCKTGGKIVLATGRSVSRTKFVYDYLIRSGISPDSIPYLICLNGAVIIDTLNGDSVISGKFFNKDICLSSKNWLQQRKLNFFIVNSKNEIFFEKNFFSCLIYFFGFKKNLKKMPLESLTDYGNIQKIMIFLKWPWANKLKKELSDVLKNDCYCSVAHEFFLEIVDSRIDKFFALGKISELLGISIDEFAAIGNEQNDVMSLENVGIGCGVDLKKKGKTINCDFEKIKFHTTNRNRDAVAQSIKFLKNEGYF